MSPTVRRAETPVAGMVIIVRSTCGEPSASDVELHQPRLILVEPDTDPPQDEGCCQDWMWRTGTEKELRHRLRQLAHRAARHGHLRPHLDDFGLLHLGLRSVALGPKEQAIARVLVDRFDAPVDRTDLVAAAWPEGIARPNVLSQRISSLRARVDCLHLEVRSDGRRHYVLRLADGPQADDVAGGFDDHLDTAGLLAASYPDADRQAEDTREWLLRRDGG